jgi:predicted flap endonuclease-1-like 5' DNA nuclease
MGILSSILIGGAVTIAVTTYYERSRKGQDVALWQDAMQMIQSQRNRLTRRAKSAAIVEDSPMLGLAAERDEPEVVAPPSADRLQDVKGIGDVFAATLTEAGITTWAQLAEQSAETLVQILDAAGYRRPPTLESWPSQAAELLAAKQAESNH